MKYPVAVITLAFLFLPSLAMVVPRVASAASEVVSPSVTPLPPDGSNESPSEHRQRIRGYRQQQSDLQQKIAALGDVAIYPMVMPVLFGVGVKDISPNFGDPRSGGRTHEGEDIMAVKGTPIISPTAAVVLRTGVGPSEGNYVYTANPGGETFVYMHLDRIGEGVVSGAVLTQGSLIGYVGNTGNASGGAAHLHFEIHNSSDTPMAPFPRLTVELSLQEKISYLSTILTQTSGSTALARFLVSNFRSTFAAALGANIILPVPIADALASIPINSPPISGGVVLPAGDLDVGSSGAAVAALQKYLIQANVGVAATRLADAGPTGNFAALTKAALIEYQLAMSISPANGYYGPATQAFVIAHPLGNPTNTAPLQDGDLARVRGENDVYIIKFIGVKKFKRLILSPSVFASYGHLKWENVKDVELAMLNAIPTSDVVRAQNDARVFRLYPLGDTGQKSWIQTAEAFVRLGLDWDSIYEINEIDRDSYVTIAPLQ